MVDAMQGEPREQRILTARRLSEPPLTLEDLAAEFNISRERIRRLKSVPLKNYKNLCATKQQR